MSFPTRPHDDCTTKESPQKYISKDENTAELNRVCGYWSCIYNARPLHPPILHLHLINRQEKKMGNLLSGPRFDSANLRDLLNPPGTS